MMSSANCEVYVMADQRRLNVVRPLGVPASSLTPISTEDKIKFCTDLSFSAKGAWANSKRIPSKLIAIVHPTRRPAPEPDITEVTRRRRRRRTLAINSLTAGPAPEVVDLTIDSEDETVIVASGPSQFERDIERSSRELVPASAIRRTQPMTMMNLDDATGNDINASLAGASVPVLPSDGRVAVLEEISASDAGNDQYQPASNANHTPIQPSTTARLIPEVTPDVQQNMEQNLRGPDDLEDGQYQESEETRQDVVPVRDRGRTQRRPGTKKPKKAKPRKYCTECAYENSFADASGLFRHVQTVHRNIVHVCPICNVTFTQTSALARHRRQQHM